MPRDVISTSTITTSLDKINTLEEISELVLAVDDYMCILQTQDDGTFLAKKISIQNFITAIMSLGA